MRVAQAGQRLLDAQRDLLSPAAFQLAQDAVLDLQSAINDRVNNRELRRQMEKLEQVADKWVRENILIVCGNLMHIKMNMEIGLCQLLTIAADTVLEYAKWKARQLLR